MSEELVDTLCDLTQIARDGQVFYEDAAAKAEDAEVRETTLAMAAVRRHLVEEFSHLLQIRGEEPPASGTLVGSMHKLYTDLRARWSGDRDGVYVSELEEAEDRLLHTFESALVDVEADDARAVLRRYVPLARAAHERMRNLKRRKGD